MWLHFFALLVIPLAIARPRFDGAWLLPLALWLVPGTFNGNTWQTGLTLVVLFSTLAVCERGTPSGRVLSTALRRRAEARAS